MACPLCGDQCRCSAAPAEDSHVSVLIDPESYDDSEQKFASTIDAADGDDSPRVHDSRAGLDGEAESDTPLGGLGSSGTPLRTPQPGRSGSDASPLAAAVGRGTR